MEPSTYSLPWGTSIKQLREMRPLPGNSGHCAAACIPHLFFVLLLKGMHLGSCFGIGYKQGPLPVHPCLPAVLHSWLAPCTPACTHLWKDVRRCTATTSDILCLHPLGGNREGALPKQAPCKTWRASWPGRNCQPWNSKMLPGLCIWPLLALRQKKSQRMNYLGGSHMACEQYIKSSGTS